MMTLDEIRQELKDRNIQAVARESGVSANAIYRLASQESRPLWSTVKALSDYFEGRRDD